MTQRVLTRLARLNVTGVFLGVAAVMVAGLLLPGTVGGWVLLALAAGLAWLLAQTWPVTAPRTRAVRTVILLALLAVAVIRLTG